MPHQAPVGEIRSPADQVKYVAVVSSVIIWDCGPDGYLWVYPSGGINIPHGFGNTNTTIKIPDREVVTFTVSRFFRFLEVDDGWLKSWVRLICCVRPEHVHDTYIPSYFSSWQQYMSQLFHTHHMIPSYTFHKWSVHS